MNEKVLDLAKTLGEGVVAGWDVGTPDPGVAFLQGKTTSMFTFVENGLNNVANAANNISNKINAAGNLKDSANQLTTTLSEIDYEEYKKTIKETAKKIYEKEIKEYAKDQQKYITDEIQTASTSYLASRTAYWTTTYSKGSVSELLAAMLSPVDDKIKNEGEEETKNRLKERVNEIKEKTAAISDVVDTTMAMAQEAIDTTLTYIQAGPKFIETTMNKQIKLILEPVKERIAVETENIINDVYNANDEVAHQLGQAAGDRITAELKRIAEQKKAKIEKAKITAISFAKSALDLVRKKALALLGG